MAGIVTIESVHVILATRMQVVGVGNDEVEGDLARHCP